MSESKLPELEGVAETLLFTLYTKAREAQRPDAMLRDESALAIVRELGGDLTRYRLHGHDEVALIMRVREFDRLVHQFLRRNPDGVVVHIGCGLDARFERVDNGRVTWFDLDLPEVIRLRQSLIQCQDERYHLLSCSILEQGWLEDVKAYRQRSFLFVAEGVLPYFETAQVKQLVLSLRKHFPAAELVCDAHTPYVIWADNLQLAASKTNARLHWGLKHGKDVESWGAGIKLLEEWFYFDQPEPRMQAYRWMGQIPCLGKSTGIFHYRLGEKTHA